MPATKAVVRPLRLTWRVSNPCWVRGRMALEAGEAPAPFRRCAVLLVCWLFAQQAFAGMSDVGTNNLELIPEKSSLWTESMLWEKDITVRAGVGYKDNVLLTPSAPQGSGFFTSGLDLSIFRLPLDGLEFNFSLTGDDTRYWRNVGVPGEDALLGDVLVQKYFSGHWRVGLDARYTYVDQVIEAFLQTGGLRPIEARGSTFGFRPFVRRDLGTNWWVQLEAPQTREWWHWPLDDSWSYGGQAVLGRTYGISSQISGSYGFFYVPHDEWLATDSAGTPIPGLKLALWRQVASLKWEHHWDEEQHWRSLTKVGFEYDRDNGGGFYNFYRYDASEELRYRTHNWQIKGTAGISYYVFPVQTISPDSSTKLNLELLDLTFRIERRLYKELRLFASFEHEQAISNDPTSEYKANIGTGGVSWEF